LRNGGLDPRPAGGLRLDLADRLFECQPFACDLRFLQGRIDATQLRNEGRSRPFIQSAASLAGVLVKTGYGAGN
jgi:hypothetical protein